MADQREIRLVGTFQDGITDKLKKLNREITGTIKKFEKLQAKLRPIARDMGVLAMASERMGNALKSQRSGFESNIRAMQQYRSEMGKVARSQRALRPTTLPAPRIPRAPRGGGGGGGGPIPRGGRGGLRFGGGGGGAGIGEIIVGSAVGGLITNAVISGFQSGVQLMTKPFEMFGRAFAERIGDEMADIQSAGGMFALDKKSKQPLFSDFEGAMAMQERLNKALAKSAAALPGATNDYVRAARGLTDTVMMAFSKNESAFKEFATELGAKQGATSEEAITKVLSRFTEQTVLLGQGQQGGMPLTMLMEQLIQKEQVSIQSMKVRYAQLRSNPLLASMLEEAQGEINKTAVGSAERFKAVMKALDNALPQEVINKMRRSVSGLQEATRSAFLDPDTGLFGLSRELDVMVPKVDQFGRYIGANGQVVALASLAVQENTSLFKILKDVLANFAVPILELLGVLPLIFDPFAQIAEQFKDLREVSNRFFLAFNTFTNGFEDQAKNFFDLAAKTTDPKIKKQIERQANMLKEQASGRGALGAINKAMLDFGAIGVKEYEKNVKQLTDFNPNAIEKFGEEGMANMAKNLLTSLVNSDLVATIVETIGSALGAVVDTAFRAIDGILSGIGGKTGNKLVDAFSKGFSSIITPERANQIADIIDRLLTKLFNMAADIIINKVIPAIGYGILKSIEAAWNAGPMGKFLVVVGVLVIFQKAMAGLALAQLAYARSLAVAQATMGASMGLRGVAGPMPTAAGTSGLMAGGSVKGFVGMLGKLAPLLTKLALILTAVVAVGGGVENTFRQISEFFGEFFSSIGGSLEGLLDVFGMLTNFTVDLVQGIIQLIAAIFNFIPGVNVATNSLDLLKIILVPITATFQLFEMGLRGLVEGLANVRLWFAKTFTPWDTKKIKELEQGVYEATAKQSASKRRIDVYNTAMRYGGSGNYAQVVERDVAAKRKQLDASKTAEERSKLNNELYMLNQTLAEARRQAGGGGGARPNTTRPTAPEATGTTPAPVVQALSTKQTETNTILAQINAKTLPGGQVNPIPAIQALNVKQSGANAFLAQLKTQMVASAKVVTGQIGASSNAQQAKTQGVTTAVNNLSAKFTAGMPVRIVGTPTVKFDMGGIGPVGGSIGGFPKTSGYGMRWGKMHQGNDYGMPVGTKLGIGGPGKVLGAGNWGGYGNAMDIGGPGGMVYRFAHLSKINAPVGANLPPGFPFALSGNTGMSTGPHLHFEARPGGAGPVNPDAFAGIIRAGYAGTPIGGILSAAQMEANKMPYGAQLAVGNSDEIFMKPRQLSTMVEGATRAGAEGVGNITTGPITISVDGYNQDPKQLTETIAAELIGAMYRKSRSEVLTS
jgi:murein DD-endopeptidase MepM/ murein hydrolase activator NlpD